MKKSIIPFLFVLLFLNSCQNELDKADWLIGNWKNASKEGVFTEKWEKKDSKSLLGNSYFVVENDTVFSEQTTLVQKDKEVFLVVKITSDPEDQATEFKLTSSTENQLVFENPAHDFPKKIVYNLIAKDSIFAEISGDGKAQGFPMKRD